MKMIKQIKFGTILMMVVGVFVLTSCDDGEDEAPALNVTSITATGTDLTSGEEVTLDLNGASSASDVPPNAIFEVTFDREVDASTVTNSSITVSDGTNTINTTAAVSGSVVTATPEQELIQGTDYTISISSSIAASDGGAFVAVDRTFDTDGRLPVVAPKTENQLAYWKFDGDGTDEMGSYNANAEIDIEYQADRFGTINSTAYFNGNTSIIEVPSAGGLMTESNSFTVSFWLKTQTEGHVNENGDPTGMFAFGLGAFFGIQYEIFGSYAGSKFAISYINDEGTGVSEDMWFPNGATDNTTGGWQGWDFAKSLSETQMQDIIKDTWYHAIYTYDAAERKGSLYFNGELMKSFDFDLWPDGDAKRSVVGVTYRGSEPDVVDDLAFGFVQSRAGTMWDSEPWGGYDIPTSQHFKGWMDDFRIFDAAYTQADVTALYDAEKP